MKMEKVRELVRELCSGQWLSAKEMQNALLKACNRMAEAGELQLRVESSPDGPVRLYTTTGVESSPPSS